MRLLLALSIAALSLLLLWLFRRRPSSVLIPISLLAIFASSIPFKRGAADSTMVLCSFVNFSIVLVARMRIRKSS